MNNFLVMIETVPFRRQDKIFESESSGAMKGLFASQPSDHLALLKKKMVVRYNLKCFTQTLDSSQVVEDGRVEGNASV